MGTAEVQAAEFALSADDYAAFNDCVHERGTKRWRFKLIRRIALVMAVLYGAAALSVNWYAGGPLVTWDNPSLIVVFLAILLFPYFRRWMTRRQYRSAVAANAKIGAPMRIEISPAGLRTTGGIAESQTPWSSIIDIAAAPAGVYLFLLKSSAYIVPRRAFADDAAFERFVAAARGHWRPDDAAAAPPSSP